MLITPAFRSETSSRSERVTRYQQDTEKLVP
jgi:hypothetical protein